MALAWNAGWANSTKSRILRQVVLQRGSGTRTGREQCGLVGFTGSVHQPKEGYGAQGRRARHASFS